MSCPTRISTYCKQHVFSKIIWSMLMVYMCGSLSYQWSQVGHALQHIITQSDFRHTHGMGLVESSDELAHIYTHKKLNFENTRFQDLPSNTPNQNLSLLKMFKHVCSATICYEPLLYPDFISYETRDLFSSLSISPSVPPPQV